MRTAAEIPIKVPIRPRLGPHGKSTMSPEHRLPARPAPAPRTRSARAGSPGGARGLDTRTRYRLRTPWRCLGKRELTPHRLVFFATSPSGTLRNPSQLVRFTEPGYVLG